MERLRDLIKQYSRWKNLEIYLNRIELNLNGDFEVAIGNTKSLIEAICKTILDERKTYQYTRSEKINKLVRKTMEALNIKQDKTISEFTNGLIKASQTLGELRNNIDSSAHGKSLLSVDNNPIEELTLYFLINSVETLACFLIEFYEIEHPRKIEKELNYTELNNFNQFLDQKHGDIEILGAYYSLSEILFHIDKIAYKDQHQKYLGGLNETN